MFWLLIIYTNSPFYISLRLVGLAVSMSFILGLKLFNWLFFAIAIIFLGGIIVIFLYITRLLRNEKLFFRSRLKIRLPLLVLAVLPVRIIETQINYNKILLFCFFETNATALMFSVFYLLMTLFVVVKICESFKGALTLYKF